MAITIKQESLIVDKLTELKNLDIMAANSGYGDIDGVTIIVNEGKIIFRVDGKNPDEKIGGIVIKEGKHFDISGINDVKNLKLINKGNPAKIHIVYYKHYK